MAEFTFQKLVIFGVGLIGGSLALALRRAHPQGLIVGVERTFPSAVRAVDLGVIDQAVALHDDVSLAQALTGADLIVLAAPLSQTYGLLARLAPHLEAHTLVTDTGSAKVSAIAAARAALQGKIGQFVPAHPIAGRALSGVEAALADLYVNHKAVLCALPENTPTAVQRIADMWRAAGAIPYSMEAEQHDAIFASVSHLPHILAFALIEQLLRSGNADLKLAFAGSGFRDFTRIAASNAEMWRDICAANRNALLSELDAYLSVLNNLRAALEIGDGATLESLFARASDKRLQWHMGEPQMSAHLEPI